MRLEIQTCETLEAAKPVAPRSRLRRRSRCCATRTSGRTATSTRSCRPRRNSPPPRTTIRPASRLAAFSASRRSKSGAATTAIPDARPPRWDRRPSSSRPNSRSGRNSSVTSSMPTSATPTTRTPRNRRSAIRPPRPNQRPFRSRRQHAADRRRPLSGRCAGHRGLQPAPRATTWAPRRASPSNSAAPKLRSRDPYDRIPFSNAVLGNNQILNTQDRNYRQPGAQLRVSYAISPEFSPFIDLSSIAATRHEDRLQRHAARSRAFRPRRRRAEHRSLSGDVSVGYLTRRFDAPNMQNVSGWIADATWPGRPTRPRRSCWWPARKPRRRRRPTFSGSCRATSSCRSTTSSNHGSPARCAAAMARISSSAPPHRQPLLRRGRWSLQDYPIRSISRARCAPNGPAPNMAMNDILAIIGLVGVRLQY